LGHPGRSSVDPLHRQIFSNTKSVHQNPDDLAAPSPAVQMRLTQNILFKSIQMRGSEKGEGFPGKIEKAAMNRQSVQGIF
jgi:hypothetical protein